MLSLLPIHPFLFFKKSVTYLSEELNNPFVGLCKDYERSENSSVPNLKEGDKGLRKD